MKRRAFITLLGGAAAWPIVARAQQTGRVAKIGILAWGVELTNPAIDSFRRELRNIGYVEGRDVILEFRYAGGDPARITELAVELVQMPVDIIVSDGTPATVAARQATTTRLSRQLLAWSRSRLGSSLATRGLRATLLVSRSLPQSTSHRIVIFGNSV
jgi:hypothetical protein